MDYKGTLNLPKTEFPMKANLAQREPEFLERWEKSNIYRQMVEKNAGHPSFVLHDGPPYANGNIHVGHALNKILKDIVVRVKNMSGFKSPYIPGWDCHGLPIEYQVVRNLGPNKKNLSPLELRKECRKYAEQFVSIQRAEFKRLEILGEWETPYRTMDPSYQAQIVREFGKVVEKGYVYRSRKTVHWCIYCKTALADAEIEYAEKKSPSIYVAYRLSSEANAKALIWTTTPWTLPASMAIAFHPKETYVWVSEKKSPEKFLMAKERVDGLGREQSVELQIIEEIPSDKMKSFKAKHPWLDRPIPFLPGEHVTLDTGTGLVHTAPGHGEDDYELGRAHQLDIYSPVQEDGRFDDSVQHFAGEKVFEANPKIMDHLVKEGALFGKAGEITHSYPHCWRCKNPIIFRATAQWFMSLSHQTLRDRALKEIDRLKWIPPWGRERIHGMISARPDWCLSRQRLWGVPLVSFRCKTCEEHLLSSSVIAHVANLFEQKGADLWFEKSASELLPSKTNCPSCKGDQFEKGEDILDVWFDSGTSHAAVLETRNLGWPADLYLEGSDQHRGWFHSSLLEALATRGSAPYKAVLTHGFVVDGQGKKMSKSMGNVIAPQEVIKERGAEILRLWVATEDYRDDIRLSKQILDRVTEAYRRIRNTARYGLSNLYDFSPEKIVPADQWSREIDHWIHDRWQHVIARVTEAYSKYEFHTVVSAINEFCVVDLSSLYLDISKDTLYCDGPQSLKRSSAQSVLFLIVRDMAKILAPLLPMTAEEIWDFLPNFPKKSGSVHLEDLPNAQEASASLLERWENLLKVRGEVSKALEGVRQQKGIGQSLEACVELVVPENFKTLLKRYEKELSSLFIVSRAYVVDKLSPKMIEFTAEGIPNLQIGVRPIEGNRCERCWMYAIDIASNPKYPTLCNRCAGVVDTK